MSLRYGFVTPLTSMLVTKPDTEEGPASPLIADKLTESMGACDFFLFLNIFLLQEYNQNWYSTGWLSAKLTNKPECSVSAKLHHIVR